MSILDYNVSFSAKQGKAMHTQTHACTKKDEAAERRIGFVSARREEGVKQRDTVAATRTRITGSFTKLFNPKSPIFLHLFSHKTRPMRQSVLINALDYLHLTRF